MSSFPLFENADARAEWFVCVRLCIQRKWQNGMDHNRIYIDPEHVTPGWNEWCNECNINDGSKRCCDLQVEAEQKGLTDCLLGECGLWEWGNSFPMYLIPGWYGDFNDEKRRLEHGKDYCCPNK